MADTRGIRELFEKFKDSEEYDHICDTTYSVEEEEMQIVVAFAESIVEQCCKDVCADCRNSDLEAAAFVDGKWRHKVKAGRGAGYFSCEASAILSRWQRGEQ